MNRKNRVHQRKIERLDNRNIINVRKLGRGTVQPERAEWLFRRQSIKDMVRCLHLIHNRAPKMSKIWMKNNKVWK